MSKVLAADVFPGANPQPLLGLAASTSSRAQANGTLLRVDIRRDEASEQRSNEFGCIWWSSFASGARKDRGVGLQVPEHRRWHLDGDLDGPVVGNGGKSVFRHVGSFTVP
jgi:hypothetical protein